MVVVASAMAPRTATLDTRSPMTPAPRKMPVLFYLSFSTFLLFHFLLIVVFYLESSLHRIGLLGCMQSSGDVLDYGRLLEKATILGNGRKASISYRDHSIVAGKPNDLAGKLRGFGTHRSPRSRNENGIKDIGLDTRKLNTPGQTHSLTEPLLPEKNGRVASCYFVGAYDC